MFARSKEALSELQSILHCGKCNEQNEELLCLGECQHWFCRSCAESSAGNECPTCGVPSKATKTHVDVQLSNVVSLCSQMMKLINGHNNVPGDNVRNDEDEVRMQVSGRKGKSIKIGKGNTKKTSLSPSGSNFLESGDFVKLKSCKRKSISDDKSASAIPNIFDKMTEFLTPDTKKRRSQCVGQIPKNSKGKALKTSTEKISTERNAVSALDRAGICDVSSVVAKISTPQSAKRRQLQSKLSKRNAKGETALQVAAIKKNIDEVKRLLEAGANPNVKDNAGWTPLHEAICVGNYDIAALLIENGASVNTPGMENSTPLHEAVAYEFVDCVQLLLDNGADIFCRNLSGYSPIDVAKGTIKEMLLQMTQSYIVSEVDVSLLDESSKPLCLTGSNLSKEQSKLLTQHSKALQAKVVKEFTPEVTHLITNISTDGSCSRTNKYLKAIVTGKWVVGLQWLENCLKQNTRVPEDTFQVSGCTFHPKSDAPKRALHNRLKQLPPLLDGCQVYFYKFGSSSHREELASLVTHGGGIVLKREPHLHNLDDYPYTHPYHAQGSTSLADCTIYIIYEDTCPYPPSVEATRMVCLPASWLIDSISSFSLLDKNLYVNQ